MSDHKPSKGRGFSIFRSAREEAAAKCVNPNRAEAGGHMNYVSGRIVFTPGEAQPFKATMSKENGETFERSFHKMEDAEAFVRRNTPRPLDRSTTYDHDTS